MISGDSKSAAPFGEGMLGEEELRVLEVVGELGVLVEVECLLLLKMEAACVGDWGIWVTCKFGAESWRGVCCKLKSLDVGLLRLLGGGNVLLLLDS
jgi:hypothetical protein